MSSGYGPVLRTPGSRPLMAAALLGRLPLGMASLALLLLVRQESGSYTLAAVTVGAFTVMSAVAAPAQGWLVDRFGRTNVLVPAAAAQALTLVVLVLAASARAPAPALVALAALAGALMPPVAPSMRALLREVFPDPEVRETAYALDSVVQEVVWTAGPLLVAVVIAAASPAVALVLVGVVCVTGTSLFVRSPLARRRQVRGSHPRRRSVLENPVLRRMLGPVALNGLALGATEVGLPAVALHAGHRGMAGVLLALWSLGSMAGGLLYGLRSWQVPVGTRYRRLLLLAVVCTAPLIAARSIPVAALSSFLAGIAIAPVFSCQYALVGESVAGGSETEAFTWVTGALVGGAALGTALGGMAVGQTGLSAPFALACLADAVAAALALAAAQKWKTFSVVSIRGLARRL